LVWEIGFNFNGVEIKRKIIGIEGIRPLEEKNNCGVVIESINEKEVAELRNWQPKGLIDTTYSKEIF